ncbi:MAG: PD40 domain-containing protein [Blastocatellia bacterium]|nr:PD40 domain-containing protein [Blastocatellia bacterium]
MNTLRQRLRDAARIFWGNFGFTLLAIIALTGWLASPSLGQSHEVKAELFGGGVLSVGEVYRGSFMPDGRTLYFFKKVTPEQEDYRIFVSHLREGKWSEPERVMLGGDYSDLYPAISKDGKRMVFSSYRPAPGDTSPKPNAHLWYVDRQGNGWGEPVFMAAANKLGHYHSWVEFGPDKAIYFRRTTPDWSANETMMTRWNGKEFAPPVPYAEAQRWKNWRSDVRVAGASPGPDGKVLFLDVATRNPKTGRGASDIWVSFKRGNDWSEPKPLGAGINSDGYDVFPFFSPDGKELYFVRDFAAFYRVRLQDALKTAQ